MGLTGRRGERDTPDRLISAVWSSGIQVSVRVRAGARADTRDPEWCEVYLEEPSLKLAFQQVDRYQAPEWPDSVPQQLHLDLTVPDLEAASARAVSLGAAVLTGPVEEPGGVFIVHADPARHPFCLFMERPDAEGTSHHAYHAQRAAAYLIRPDGYIAYRSQSADPAPLLGYLDTVLARRPSRPADQKATV